MTHLMLVLSIIAVSALIGGIVQGSTGMGFGLIVVGVLSLVLDIEHTTLVVISITSVLALWIVVKFRTYVDWKGISFILISGVIGRILSFVVDIHWGSSHAMKILLGFLLISIAILARTSQMDRWLNRQSIPLELCVGFIGGLVGGVFAVSGPIFATYFLCRYDDKRTYTVCLQILFLIFNCTTLTLFSAAGFISTDALIVIAVGIAAAVIGLVIGLKLFERLQVKGIKRAVYGFISVSGGWIIALNTYLLLGDAFGGM